MKGWGIIVVCSLAATTLAWAHCDTMDGPVIAAARTALEKRDVTPVLKWVKKDGEAEIRAVFQKALAVRGKGTEAKELADRYFFETLVRIHRAGEGEPYTGLKPAGAVEPAVAAADKALDNASVDELVKEVTKTVADGIRKRFERALKARRDADSSVEAGREYVEAYVDYVHYVEGIHAVAGSGAAHNHHEE